jgi:hypothetical protein
MDGLNILGWGIIKAGPSNWFGFYILAAGREQQKGPHIF